MNSNAAAGRRRVISSVFGGSLGVQAVLIALGLAYIITPSTNASFVLLLAWAVVGSVYVVGIWSVLAAASRWAETDDPPVVLELSAPSRVISLVGTVLVSAVGVAATVQHILFDPTQDDQRMHDIVVVWAMILAWMLLHWGFSQLYLQQYYRSTDRPLEFPNTRTPGVLEFAYFSYTVAISLAVSDVRIRDRRMRFRVLVHAVTSFFFNALIVVTAVDAITSRTL